MSLQKVSAVWLCACRHMIPAVLRGHDVLAAGPPGAGTSTGALLAVTCRVLSTPRSLRKNKAMPLALIVCPSRELAVQLAAEGARLVAGTQLTVKCVTGGAQLAQQVGAVSNLSQLTCLACLLRIHVCSSVEQ